jgi:hypothetical protein
MTNAEPFPAAKLEEGSHTGSSKQKSEVQTDAFNTPVFAM